MRESARSLGFWDIVCLGLNSIIGTGIFVFPGQLFSLIGPLSITAFLVCAALLVPVALCYAELGGMYRGSGGSYLYAREAFGPEAGFAMGFLSWAASVFSVTAVASGLSSQMGWFHPAFASPAAGKALAIAGLAVFGAVNYRGIRPGAFAVNALTAAKLLPLCVFAGLGMFHMKGGRFHPFVSGEGSYRYAVFLCLWALQGFEVAPIPAGESRDPEKSVPLAVVGSLLAAGLLYAWVQFVAVGVYPELGKSARPLADAAAAFMGSGGGTLMALGGVVSMLGFIAGDSLGSPRYLSALGEADFKSLRLGEPHPRWHTPHRAILWTGAASVTLVLSFDLVRLIDLSNVAVASQYLSTCAALLVLRRRAPGAGRSFRVPWAGLIASAGCAVALWLMAVVSGEEARFFAAVLLAGYALRYLERRAAS